MIFNRVRETTLSTGVGALTLAGAAAGYRSFNAAAGINTRFYYWVVDSTNNTWECGMGYLSDATTMVRETVLDNSSGTTTALDFLAGEKEVFCAPPDDAAFLSVPYVSATSVKCVTSATAADLGSISLTPDTIYYSPFLFAAHGLIDAIGTYISTAVSGGKVRCGLYSIGADGMPSRLVLESGDIGTDPTGIKFTSFPALKLPVGWYYAAVMSNVATAVSGSSNFYEQTGPVGLSSDNLRHYNRLDQGTFTSGWVNLPAIVPADPVVSKYLYANGPRIALRMV